MYKKSLTKSKSYKKYGKKRTIRKSRKSSFVKKVQAIIHKEVETKIVSFNSNVTAFNQGMTTTGDCLRLMPDIQQTSGQGGRVGNTIKIQSLKIRGVMTFNLGQITQSPCRIGVRLLVVKPKSYKDWISASNVFGVASGVASYTRLLEGVNTGFTGTAINYNTPINTDAFSCIYEKRFYISQSFSLASTHTNEVYNSTKFVNFEVPYCRNRTLHYDDNNATPTDFPYFMLIGYCMLDGNIPDALSNLQYQYNATVRYEDA